MNKNDRQLLNKASWVMFVGSMGYLAYKTVKDFVETRTYRTEVLVEENAAWKKYQEDLREVTDDLDRRIETAKFWLIGTEENQ